MSFKTHVAITILALTLTSCAGSMQAPAQAAPKSSCLDYPIGKNAQTRMLIIN